MSWRIEGQGQAIGATINAREEAKLFLTFFPLNFPHAWVSIKNACGFILYYRFIAPVRCKLSGKRVFFPFKHPQMSCAISRKLSLVPPVRAKRNEPFELTQKDLKLDISWRSEKEHKQWSNKRGTKAYFWTKTVPKTFVPKQKSRKIAPLLLPPFLPFSDPAAMSQQFRIDSAAGKKRICRLTIHRKKILVSYFLLHFP